MAKKKGKAGFLFMVERAEIQTGEIEITLRCAYDPLSGFHKNLLKAMHNSRGKVWLFFGKEKRDKE